MGERDFEAQYNQRPCAGGGTLFQLSWLRRYEMRPEHYKVEVIIQSWNTAYETERHNDYSVCSTWALSGTSYFLLDIYRERLTFDDQLNSMLQALAYIKSYNGPEAWVAYFAKRAIEEYGYYSP
ncbi:hypothetical protein [Aquisediminimonas sediminicola]|uniref:hypothetical protein n=1 Tax=Alteraquisediminimonas sediminicola TaxID=2676787 RepID=UPI001C8EDFE2|nr:hypothetical protein [Aquisediminimonas sediminicola]